MGSLVKRDAGPPEKFFLAGGEKKLLLLISLFYPFSAPADFFDEFCS